MWTFTSSGMHMPALIPPSVLAAAKTPDIQEAVERGWELQVRGRVREHLQYWIDTFMPADSCSIVYESRGKDYNVRFYTTREAYGEALKQQALNIDYIKFKSTAENFPWGKRYHDLLLKVWGASTMLGRPYQGESTSLPERPQTDRDRHRTQGYRSYKRGNPRKPQYTGSTFFEDHDWDAPGGFDDLPMALTRSSKSIHDMTDAELEDYDLNG